MAALYPFAALRPTPAAVLRVAAVPYDVVNSDEARALAGDDPLSFLRVSRPEIECPPGTYIYSDEVYAKAEDNFDRLRRAAPLVVEDVPSLYVYRLHMGEHVQTGVAACYSIDEYARELIKKHEKTRPDKEDDRTRHMLALRRPDRPGVPHLSRLVGRGRGRPGGHRRRAAVRLHRRRRRAARRVARRRSRPGTAGRGVCRRARALHRRRPPSRRQRLAHPSGPGRRGSGRARARSWRWRSPTTRCRCCPITASCAT